MRSPEELLLAYEIATKYSPLVIANGESDNFSKAMRLIWKREDARMGRQISSITLMDKDKLLANGILSPLDQKTAFHNRKDWGEHLKRNGCVEIGNDLNKATEKKREIKGDFDCRAELGKVTHQVMEKYGH